MTTEASLKRQVNERLVVLPVHNAALGHLDSVTPGGRGSGPGRWAGTKCITNLHPLMRESKQVQCSWVMKNKATRFDDQNPKVKKQNKH